MSEWIDASGMGEGLGREQAQQMLDFYCKTLSDLGYSPKPYPDVDGTVGANIYSAGKFEVMNHALWMCGQAAEFLRQNRMPKAYRWIGMIQGILFMGGVFTISELKKHNSAGV